MKTIITQSILIVLLVFFSQSISAQPVNNKACKSFFNVYCTGCHSHKRICENLKTKNKKEWKETLAEMAQYGEYDNQEISYAFECITSLKPGSGVVCKKKP
jgi:hypothetical protein